MVFIVLIAVFFIVMCIYTFSVAIPKSNEQKSNANSKIEKYLSDNSVIKSADYSFESASLSTDYNGGIYIRFIADNNNRKIHLIENHGTVRAIPFAEVIGCEIVVDSEVCGGVGRAIVGGALAGNAGAIVGAVTAKPHIMSYKVVLYLENIHSPSIELPLIKQKTATKDSEYIKAQTFAQKVFAIVKVIVHQNEGMDKKDLAKQLKTDKSYDVVFDVPVGDRLNAIIFIRDLMGMELVDAKDYVETPNSIIYSSVDLNFANSIVSKLEVKGVRAKVVETETPKLLREDAEETSTAKHEANSIADEIEKLYQLKEKGIITEEEFNQQKGILFKP